jgi:ketosteroid isomerase-like protein
MRHCNNCNLEYPDVAQFCKSCGGALLAGQSAAGAARNCPACAAAVKPGWKFCKQCGLAFAGSRLLSSETIQASSFASAATPRTNRRFKKLLVITAVLVLSLLFATGVAAAGWYALGVKVVVQTDPAKSKIVIDGQDVGNTNAYGTLTTSRLRAGDHTLIVRQDGYDEWKQTFNIAFADFSKNLNIKLNATKYKLTLVSSPGGSEVLVDSVSMGSTNESTGVLETTPLTPGEHTVIVRRDGYREWKEMVKLSADQKLDVTLTSVPVADQNSSSADTDIRNSLEGWAQTSRNRDVDGHLQYYADTLDFYYGRTMVPSSKVREDRNRAFAKFNSIGIQLANINIQLDSTGQRATVTLDKTFDFRGDNNAFFNGSVQTLLALTKLGGSWLITGEKELKVYYVNK